MRNPDELKNVLEKQVQGLKDYSDNQKLKQENDVTAILLHFMLLQRIISDLITRHLLSH